MTGLGVAISRDHKVSRYLGLKNYLSGNSLFMFLINSEQRIACLTAKFINMQCVGKKKT
jgi:hypothetical protein